MFTVNPGRRPPTFWTPHSIWYAPIFILLCLWGASQMIMFHLFIWRFLLYIYIYKKKHLFANLLIRHPALLLAVVVKVCKKKSGINIHFLAVAWSHKDFLCIFNRGCQQMWRSIYSPVQLYYFVLLILLSGSRTFLIL